MNETTTEINDFELTETRISTPLMLAQRVMDMFTQAGATPKEQDTALDLAKILVLDLMYRPTGGS